MIMNEVKTIYGLISVHDGTEDIEYVDQSKEDVEKNLLKWKRHVPADDYVIRKFKADYVEDEYCILDMFGTFKGVEVSEFVCETCDSHFYLDSNTPDFCPFCGSNVEGILYL